MQVALPQTFIEDATVQPKLIEDCVERLARFAERYRSCLTRSEQDRHLQMYLEGLVSGLERKSIEPIATEHGVYRRPLQHFVGAGKWSDSISRRDMHQHVEEEIGDPNGVFILDGSGFEKSGPESVGVARQWCGRLGKVENCQVGFFLAYSSPKGATLLDAELYLPEDWAEDLARRAKTHVPPDIEFQKNWELTDLLLQRVSPRISHAWVIGDDEFGRPQEFRDRLADRNERYLLEVPCNTNVRRPGSATWESVQKLKKKRQRWTHFRLRDGEKGPLEVKAFSMKVETPRKGAPHRQETLFIMQTIGGSETWYYLAPKGTKPDTAKLVHVAAHRHHIEQLFESAKGDVGLDHYEVRSWIGWHHHMTLSMLALWFLVLERRRLKKNSRPYRLPCSLRTCRSVEEAPALSFRHRGRHYQATHPQRSVPLCPLAKAGA